MGEERSGIPARGKILREGYPFILPPLALGIAGFGVGWSLLGWAGIVVAFSVAMFFRNPTRRPLRDPRVVLSPADGRVVQVAEVEDPLGEKGHWTKVSIFMSVFNVHVNRSPVAGRVVEVRHEKGTFRPADKNEASNLNERNILRMETKDGRRVLCVQVAGILARRIVCWVKEGMVLPHGLPIGMIRFGSRVDTYLPPGFDPDVRIGQRVWGGETILGYWVDKRESLD
jgi:phosphatidylserine decarboxylase